MTKVTKYNLAELVGSEMTAQEVRKLLMEAAEDLGALKDSEFKAHKLGRVLRGVAERNKIEAKQVIRPLRVILQGWVGSHGFYDTMALVGRDEIVRLIGGAVRSLGDRA